MKKLLLLPGLVLLSFCAGCGVIGSGNGGGGGGGNLGGNFSNASLNGNYAFQVSGTDLNNFALYREAGVFSADGNGHITAGTDDFSEGSGVPSSDPITGVYSIDDDGTGTMQFNFTSGVTETFAFTMKSSSKFYMVPADLLITDFFANGAGVGEKQDTTAFAAAPSGTFVFSLQRQVAANSSFAPTYTVGAFTLAGGNATGNEDQRTLASTITSLTLTAHFNTPDTSGRGTGTLTNQNSVTTTFAYYVVDASNIRFFTTDSSAMGLGRAEAQTAGPYNVASLSGGYAFGGRGDTGNFFDSIHTVGRFDGGGDGTISNGAFDSVQDGATSTNVAFPGTYVIQSNGRAAVTLTPSTGTQDLVFWMVSPNRAFFLNDDANSIEAGTIDKQLTNTFSNSTIQGQFAFVMDGFDFTPETVARVGAWKFDGDGKLKFNEFVNLDGSTNAPGLLSGTYSATANGRVTGTMDGITNNLVLYMVSGSNGYLLLNDTNTQVSGVTSEQQ